MCGKLCKQKLLGVLAISARLLVPFHSKCFREMGTMYSARCWPFKSFINFFSSSHRVRLMSAMSLRSVTQRRHFHRIISIGSSILRARTPFLRNCAIAVMLRTCVVGQNAAYFREFVCVCVWYCYSVEMVSNGLYFVQK